MATIHIRCSGHGWGHRHFYLQASLYYNCYAHYNSVCFGTQTFYLSHIKRPSAACSHRATFTANQQWADSELLLGGSLLSTRPGPRQIHTGEDLFKRRKERTVTKCYFRTVFNHRNSSGLHLKCNYCFSLIS